MSLHPIDRSLAAVLPYGHFVDDGEIYLRGKGLMVGYEMHGMSVEGSSQRETEAQAQRLGRAISHFGSNDMLQCIFQRRPAIDYPERRFTSRAARMLDQERRQQFAEQKYWRTDALRRVRLTGWSALTCSACQANTEFGERRLSPW